MRRFLAPERDCREVEEEETTAVILPQLDLLRVALVVGGERRRPRLPHCHGAEAARVWQGEKEGEEEQRGAEGVLMLQRGGQGARARRWRPRRQGARGASAFPVATGKVLTGRPHPSGF